MVMAAGAVLPPRQRGQVPRRGLSARDVVRTVVGLLMLLAVLATIPAGVSWWHRRDLAAQYQAGYEAGSGATDSRHGDRCEQLADQRYGADQGSRARRAFVIGCSDRRADRAAHAWSVTTRFDD